MYTKYFSSFELVYSEEHDTRIEAMRREFQLKKWTKARKEALVKGDPEVKKPSVLYHASQNRNIELLEPRAEGIRHPDEGPVVFATAEKPYHFLGPGGDSWTRTMKLNGILVHVISDRERYEREDKGGAIYYLDPATFSNEYPKYGGSRGEWTSKVPVKPFKKEEYESGLQAQLENGIQVFFVDRKTFERIIKAPDHGKSIIRTLVSENSVKGLNPKEIPDQLERPI